MMHRLLLVSALASVACVNVTYTRSSSLTFPAKAADCRLATMSVPPQRPFVELGTFDIEHGWPVESMSEVLEEVGARACAEGADGIIANKSGIRYGQATAIRWTGPAAPVTPGPEAAPPPAVAPVAESK